MNSLKPFEISLTGINLIEASAGTGKTHNITSLYVRALIEKPVNVDQLLVMTFTQAATKELKDRLLKRLQESIDALQSQKAGGDEFLSNLIKHVQNPAEAKHKLQNAVRSFDEAAVYTIHGFCQQVLQQYAFESGMPFEAALIPDEGELIQDLIDDYWRNWVAGASKDATELVLLKYLTDRGYDPEKFAREIGNLSRYSDKKIIYHERGQDYWQNLAAAQNALFTELKLIWQTDRAAIVAKMNYEHLNGRTYNKKSIPVWIEQMEALLTEEVVPIILFEKFENFTQTKLTSSLTTKAPGPHVVTHPFFKVAERYLNEAEKFSEYLSYFKRELITHLFKTLPLKKEQLGVLSYADQLNKIRNALRGEQGDTLAAVLRKKYPVALIDEYQDTDLVQYEIFQRIYASGDSGISFFMIGDPKQSIYGFRGADIFSYLKARNSIPPDNVFGLKHNFRSVPKLIEASNVLWSSIKAPFVFSEIAFSKIEAGKEEKAYSQLTENDTICPPLHFRKLSEPTDEKPKSKKVATPLAAEDTADEVARLLRVEKSIKIKIGDRSLSGKDIAVLVRTHDQADLIKEALQKRGIKSEQHTDRSVFKSEEAEQITYLLEAIITPGNEGLIKTVLGSSLIGYSPQELLGLEGKPDQWVEMIGLFAEWHKTWQQKGFSAMFGNFMQKMNVAEQLVKWVNGERRLTNVLHLAELLQQQAQQHDGVRRLVKWLRYKMQETQKAADEEQLRLESDEDLVKIVTIHRSKGLQFSVVFCPYLWFGPHIQDKDSILEYHQNEDAIVDFCGKNDEERTEKRVMAQREQLAEEMRLAYVAMTRAEHRCYLTWCHAKNSEFSSLGYLLYGAEASQEALSQTISKKHKSLGNQPAEEAINKLCEEFPELFSCRPPDWNENNTLDLINESIVELQPARSFKRSIPLTAGEAVSSFSSLTRKPHSDPDLPDYDQYLFEEENDEPKPSHQNDMFSFPKGPEPGTCLHKIFEEIDFWDAQVFSDAVARNLSEFDINTKWKEAVEKMLKITVRKRLIEEQTDLKLASIQPNRLVREMEFYYPSANIETEALFKIIRENKAIEGVPINNSARGFLKGFIDLTFEFEGKFYLLDYKSNHLGDTIENYDEASLQQEMLQSNYDLQYHIYTIALHRYLQNRLAGYSYEKHFGGVFYLFLRGLNNENQNGVYFDRPDVNIIKKLDNYLLNRVKG